MEKLEKTVASLAEMPRQLTDLNGRVGQLELQIVQLRTEMNEGFSALHGEIQDVRGEVVSTRNDILKVVESSSRATRVLHEEIISRIARLGEAPSRDSRS